MMNALNIKARQKRIGARAESGFTLIEISIYMAVMALVVTALLSTFDRYLRENIINRTNLAEERARAALVNYLGTFGGLPCPADPTLPADDPNAGFQQCFPTPATPGNAIPTSCNGTGGICRVEGAFPGPTSDGDFYNDPVLIGTIPYKTLGLSRTDVLDGYNNQLTFAVSEYMTYGPLPNGYADIRGVDYDQENGAIGVMQLNIDGTEGPINAYNNTHGGQLAVLSHGKDKSGAYNAEGAQPTPCDLTKRDHENCDGDGIFYIQNNNVYNESNSAERFDDPFTFFTVNLDEDNWISGAGDDISNKLLGNVGIGIATPSERLTVNGDIHIDARAIAGDFCNRDGSICFEPRLLGGYNPSASGPAPVPNTYIGIGCANGILIGIANGNPICQTSLEIAVDPGNKDCPPSEFVTGIDASGGVICAPPP